MTDFGRGYDPSKLLTWILGVVGVVVASAVVASFGLLLGMNGRLTKIETIIAESKEERRAQLEELRDVDRETNRRLTDLERVNFRRDRR